MSQRPDSLERAALAAVNIGAWEWSVDAGQITWSDALSETLGLSAHLHSTTLNDIIELIHPEDRSRFQSELEATLRAGTKLDMTHRIRVSGRERWLHARGRVLRDTSGRATRMLGIVEDVSLARALQSDRNEQSALMQAALDASVFAVVVLDRSGQIIFSNELAADLLGLTPSSVQARAYDAPQFKHTAVDGGPWPDDNQPFVRVMKTGAAVHGIEHCIERPDGRIITLRINGAPIKDDRGEIKLVVCSFEDISERRQIEAAFRQSQKMEAIGRLAGGVAHDFNNLLTAILSYAALARGETSAADVIEYLDGITEAGERAVQLTRQLLAFARREISHPKSFDARAEVKATARLIARVVGPQVTLDVSLADEPCVIRMDPNHLQQILMNLAVNARDAMPEGGTIGLSVERTAHDSVMVAVTDTGHGMDQDTKQKAFEPFFTTKPAHEGTGLGLSTCHGIVVQAGGQIRLDSALGRGTRVEIELPLVTAADAQPTTKPPSSCGAVRAARVLIVEDDPAVRRIAMHTLERAGYVVHGAAQPSHALEVLQTQPIDLIVCDLILPGMNGPDLIDRVRELQPRMPVIFVSGYSSELTRTGADPFLPKPYTPDALRQRVASVLS